MKPSVGFLVACCWVVLLTACNTEATPPPTSTSTATATTDPSPTFTLTHTASPTALPTQTPTVTATSTPLPTATRAPAATATPRPAATKTPKPKLTATTSVELPQPSGAPVSVWNGLPIMPGAISGEEKNGGYFYTVKASVKSVQNFYDKAMPQVGWEPLAAGTGQNGNLLLIYQKDGQSASVAVIAQGDTCLVLLVGK